MPWNPDTYNQFKNERYQPFYDLFSLIRHRQNLSAVDLGCGTGELTRKLADGLESSQVIGIDNSVDMLRDAASLRTDAVSFSLQRIEEFTNESKRYDLIFSNAALHWVDDHEKLIPKILSRLNPNGQLAIQVPASDNLFTHRALRDIASAAPFYDALGGWSRASPVLDIEQYARILFNQGCGDITVLEKIYPHVLPDEQAVYEWTAGTVLIRYLELLPDALKPSFITAYKERLQAEYGHSRPVFYPYRRILFYATLNSRAGEEDAEN